MSRVVICEDDGILAADLESVVTDAGHEVCGVFRTGQEAVAALRGTNADSVIIDLTLADGDTGGSVARAAQALGMRVIIVSGHSNVGRGLGKVSHTYAPKPFATDLIQQLLAPMSPLAPDSESALS